MTVADLEQTRAFYGGLLGCREGKANEARINFEFFGHHLVTHLASPEIIELQRQATAGRRVAQRHFGAILDWPEWEALATRLREKGAHFLIEPHVRYAGEAREEALLFMLDPAGNGVEFKTFRDPAFAFANVGSADVKP
ncbi:MAG TPA: VOC family protein [Caulobacteraceae bacterium]